MATVFFQRKLDCPAATEGFATAFSSILKGGDCLLLAGDIGAGKTFFARCLIQSVLPTPEDVPSPTFTLVQSYDTKIGTIHHADLYRLTGPDELIELGLLDAMGDEILLIEWPDRLGPDVPKNALTLTFEREAEPEVRHITASSLDIQWEERLRELDNV